MKSYIKIAVLLLTVSLFTISCEDDKTEIMIAANPSVPTLVGPAANVGLTFVKDEADNLIEFVWTESDFGFQAAVKYGVQLSTDDFITKSALISTEELTGSMKVGNLNAVLLGLELPIGEVSTVKCRAYATVNTHVDTVFSEPVSYEVVPYETLIDYPVVYLPGAYQGWDPAAVTIAYLYSYAFDEKYENTLYFDAAGEFKITTGQNWDVNYGGAGGVLEAGGANFSVPGLGAYIFKADLGALTYSIEATDYWGVIGGSIPPFDWSVDVDMYYNGQRKVWEVTGDFKAGEFKFRANDDWALNFGDSGADGTLDNGGDNIVIAADGNYTIRFDLVNNTYVVIKN